MVREASGIGRPLSGDGGPAPFHILLRMAGAGQTYDAIVVGVGGMGSATLYELARRGVRALGIEQFRSGHDRGSSHGETRIIRMAYYEDLAYVPLLQRAFTNWRALEVLTGERLLTVTGSIDAGPPESLVFAGSLESCRTFDLRHEVLTSRELTARCPGYAFPPETMAVLQPDGGYLEPARCVRAYAAAAVSLGATLHQDERVLGWEADDSGVTVRTDAGEYHAETLVLSAGAWLSKLAPELGPLAAPERQVVAWFDAGTGGLFEPERFPVFNASLPEGRYYGFPAVHGEGLKIGRYHHLDEPADPDALDREVHPRDIEVPQDCVSRYFTGAGAFTKASVCMFTNTPDEHFVIDRLPREPRVVVVSPCSGHGFKFCSVIGEVVADLVVDGETKFDISLFRLGRFAA
jgi:sarcosine oxidase